MSKTPKLFQLKIKLHGSKPPIWREIIVPADYTFFDLHVAIQNAFGWLDCHLHQYFTENPYKRDSQYENIALPQPEMEDVIDERKVRLNEYFKAPKDTMLYEYDFGDGWMHEIKLKNVLPREAKEKYPQIIKGKYACPPEDCGGLGGYYDLIEVMKNPKNPEHNDMLDWLNIEDPAEFDPENFDIDKVVFEDPKKILREYEKNF